MVPRKFLIFLSLIAFLTLSAHSCAGLVSYNLTITESTHGYTAWETGTYTELPLGDDTVTVVNLTFAFQFFDVSYTQVGISTNGNLQFVTRNTTYKPQIMPYTTDKILPIFAAYFVDLYSDSSVGNQYRFDGDAPYRSFTFRYNNVSYFETPTSQMFFDVVLYETTNVIQTLYYTLAESPDTDSSVLIGLQNTSIPDDNGSYDYTSYLNKVVVTETIVNALEGKTIEWTMASVPPRDSSSSGGAWSSSGDVLSSSLGTSSSADSPSSSPSSSSSSPFVPVECITSPDLVPIGATTVGLYFNVCSTTMPEHFFPTLIQAIEKSLSIPDYYFICGNIESANVSLLTDDAECETKISTVFVVPRDNQEGSVVDLTNRLVSLVETDSGALTAQFPEGFPQLISSSIDTYKICRDGSHIPITEYCSDEPHNQPDDGGDKPPVAGIVIGVLVGVAVVALAGFLIHRKYYRNRNKDTEYAVMLTQA